MISVLLPAVLVAACPAPHAVEDRPNVVVFIVDDMGWQDTSVPFHVDRTPFNDRYRTPNMERLADQGMKLTNGYASAPVCTPTRTSLMTGRAPARNRITYWTLNRNADTSSRHEDLLPPAWNVNGLQPGDLTLSELLADRGYRTIHAGKAHWGTHDTAGGDPTKLGFEVNIAGHASGAPGSYYGKHRFKNAKSETDFSKDTKWDVPGLERFHDQDIYLTEALQVRAVEEIDRAVADDVPFYLHFAPYAVHTPIMPNRRYLENYAELHPREAAYATMVESMDVALGEILDTLDRNGVAEDTIVIFTSDNGGLSAHARGGEAHTHNKPLRSGKGSAYEGGVRVPWIIHWPGRTEPGSVSAVPIVTQDLFPTILAATGGMSGVPSGRTIDGLDLRPVLEGLAPDHFAERPIVFHQPHAWGPKGPGIQPYTAIRSGDWKLLYFHANRRFELYDLSVDVAEANDLAAERPDVVRRLAELLGDWMREAGAQMSIDRMTGDPVEWPDRVTLSSDASGNAPNEVKP